MFPQMKQLPHLTSLAITSTVSYPCSLEHCPQFYNELTVNHHLVLQDIYLHFESSNYSQDQYGTSLFENAHWPSLRRFTLKWGGTFFVQHIGVTGGSFSRFLARHVTIAALWISASPLQFGVIEDGTLPNIQSIHIAWCEEDEPFPVPRQISSRLTHFSTLTPRWSDISLYYGMKNLKDFYLVAKSPHIICALAEYLPLLERLECRVSPKSDRFSLDIFRDEEVCVSIHSWLNYPYTKMQIDTYIEALSHFKALTHLAAFLSHESLSMDPYGHRFVPKLANAIPTLSYIQLHDRTWVEIERDRNGKCVNFQHIYWSKFRGRYWGLFYQGTQCSTAW